MHLVVPILISLLISFSSSSSLTCGNDVTDAGEACDGTDLRTPDCSAFPGFSSGSIKCKIDCSGYDFEECVSGKEIISPSCSMEDVQDAIDSAQDGDTVMIPEGTCRWNGAVVIGEIISWSPTKWNSTNIILIGAGMKKTVIIDDTDASSTPLSVGCSLGKSFRVSGITFTGMDRTTTTEPAITVGGHCENWRIDHCEFNVSGQDTKGRGIMVSTLSFGLIDHCTFDDTYQCIWVSDDLRDLGAVSWTEEMSFGKGLGLFIEDNFIRTTYKIDGSVDCRTGGRYIFRYNRIEGAATTGNHGYDSATRSCLHFEAYGNVKIADDQVNQGLWAFQLRGGTAMIWNNTVDGYKTLIGVTSYRSCCYAGASCGSKGTCNGSNPIDGNMSPISQYKGYPCYDQVGRGTNQSLQPLYSWDNLFNGDPHPNVSVYSGWPTCIDPHPSDHIKPNRDYFNNIGPPPDYIPYVYPHPLNAPSFDMHTSSSTSTPYSHSLLIIILFSSFY